MALALASNILALAPDLLVWCLEPDLLALAPQLASHLLALAADLLVIGSGADVWRWRLTLALHLLALAADLLDSDLLPMASGEFGAVGAALAAGPLKRSSSSLS